MEIDNERSTSHDSSVPRTLTKETIAAFAHYNVKLHNYYRSLLVELERLLERPRSFAAGIVNKYEEAVLDYAHDLPPPRSVEDFDPESYGLTMCSLSFEELHLCKKDNIQRRLEIISIQEIECAIRDLKIAMGKSLNRIQRTLQVMKEPLEFQDFDTYDRLLYDPDASIIASWDQGQDCIIVLEIHLKPINQHHEQYLKPFLRHSESMLTADERACWEKGSDAYRTASVQHMLSKIMSWDYSGELFQRKREKLIEKYVAYSQIEYKEQLVRFEEQLREYRQKLLSSRKDLPREDFECQYNDERISRELHQGNYNV